MIVPIEEAANIAILTEQDSSQVLRCHILDHYGDRLAASWFLKSY
jgi:hypothetical protein